jgi:hypothetical protein
MTITAKFSNGHTDAYNGKRDVKAAWMMVTPTGSIYSGHSLTVDAATKTANSKISEVNRVGETRYPQRGSAVTFHHFAQCAKKDGFDRTEDWFEANKQKAVEYRAACTVEIINL